MNNSINVNAIVTNTNNNVMEEKKMVNMDKVNEVIEARMKMLRRRRGSYQEATKGQAKLLARFVYENNFDMVKMGHLGFSAYSIVNSMHAKEMKAYYAELLSLMGPDATKINDVVEVIVDYIAHCRDSIGVISDTNVIERFDACETEIISDFADVVTYYFEDLASSFYNVDTDTYLNTAMAYTVRIILQLLLEEDEDFESDYNELFGEFTEDMRNTVEQYKDLLLSDFGILFIIEYNPNMWRVLAEKISNALCNRMFGW